mmetsp:Transcript_17811/g.45193  ORF Transcript_17811/g.45193 Transcript_17811/m.45193 type:complete len:422 (-) Transcript_17811:438-1703(-)
MELVPLDRVHGHVVALVRLKVLTAIGLTTLVDLPFFRAHYKEMLALAVEVKAAAARKAGQGGLLVRLVLFVGDELELHHRLHLERALTHGPVRNLTVRGDGEEAQFLSDVLLLPADLPHRIGVLTGLDGRDVDRLVELAPHVVDHDGAVVAADCEERAARALRVEVERHDAGLGGEGKLGIRRVLERIAADHAGALPHKVVAAIADCEQVWERRVPADGRDLLALDPVVGEAPEREQTSFPVPEGVALVFPEAKVLVDLELGVLVDHALEDLERLAHILAVHNVSLLLSLLLVAIPVALRVLVCGQGACEGARRLFLLLGRSVHDLLVLDVLEKLADVEVVDFPLADGVLVVAQLGRLGGDAAGLLRVVEGLRGAVAVIELVLGDFFGVEAVAGPGSRASGAQGEAVVVFGVLALDLALLF